MERHGVKRLNNIRELVLDMLIEILEKESYSHLVIRGVLDKYNYMEGRDKAFLKRVTEGTLERLIQIDYILDQFSKVPVKKMKPFIRNLLRMSVYQLLYMDSVPDSAVCNEAVKLAGKRGFRSLSGYVNGVLRGIARNKENIVYPDSEKERETYYSVKYSIPKWLVSMWIDAYGEEKTVMMLEGLLKEHPVTVRLSKKLTGQQKETWFAALDRQGVRYHQHPYLTCAHTLEDTEGIANLPDYESGYFTVQDVSSMLAVKAAGIQEYVAKVTESKDGGALAGQRAGIDAESLPRLVLDVCAAPGGKSLYAAELLGNAGKVISRDLTEYKVSLIRDNIERMGSDNVETQVWDALTFDEDLKEKADVVLADLPCSGLGIMGKKRDIRYRIRPDKLKELAELQKNMLSVVWQYVKPGGVLIYSTCTVSPSENEEVVKWFTDKYPFTLESLTPYLPKPLQEEGKDGMLQLMPGIHETDGFFVARLRRIEET